MKMLIQVTTSYFCCGLIVDDAVVVEAAPIMRWAVGKPFDEVAKWIRSKNGKWSTSLGGGEDAESKGK